MGTFFDESNRDSELNKKCDFAFIRYLMLFVMEKCRFYFRSEKKLASTDEIGDASPGRVPTTSAGEPRQIRKEAAAVRFLGRCGKPGFFCVRIHRRVF